MRDISSIEQNRQELQRLLDGQKTQEERNAGGQFSTPIDLAEDILRHAKTLLPNGAKVCFLDPGFGTGSFFSTLLSLFAPDRIARVIGYEIDLHYGKPAKELWIDTPLDLRLRDFTKEIAPQSESEKYNLIICNPPYVRHHHIVNTDKIRLQQAAFQASGMTLSGLSGLYCYFLAISHGWMKENGVAGWLIPSEFMDVNYGKAVKQYLLGKVTLLQIHRFNPSDVQFDDALVSSAIIWLKNKPTPKGHKVKFTFGGSIDSPDSEKEIPVSILSKETKWTRFPLLEEREQALYPKLGEFFTVKRGIATGDNAFFVLTMDEIKKRRLPLAQFKPILPSPRYVKEREILADDQGNPLTKKRLFVLDCKLPLGTVERKYPELWNYLQEGIQKGVPERYLCRHRKPWYSQEYRPSSLFYCTYIGRSDAEGRKPFRFILNHSRAIVANVYLILYPRPDFQKAISSNPGMAKSVVNALNEITAQSMFDEGRVYGGGLHKLEPRELSNINATALLKAVSNLQRARRQVQLSLFADATV
ncbi:MAG: restriction endonuclease subunit M [Planctomycetes bacterium RBG_16_55_9]|nr:MAG: restriction endonuclease subunit M [Planctomycetes bacterium RBG_16_55_9]